MRSLDPPLKKRDCASKLFKGLCIVVGSFISGATFTPDYVRSASSARMGFWLVFFAFLLGNSFMFIAGIVGTWTTGNADVIQLLMAQGISLLGFIFLGFSVWTTSDNSLYTSSLAISHFTPMTRRQAVLGAGLLGALCADWLYQHMIGWLQLLGLFIPPIGLLLILDHFFGAKLRGHRYLSFLVRK